MIPVVILTAALLTVSARPFSLIPVWPLTKQEQWENVTGTPWRTLKPVLVPYRDAMPTYSTPDQLCLVPEAPR